MSKLFAFSLVPLATACLVAACAGEPPPQAASSPGPAAPPAAKPIDTSPIAAPVANVPPTCAHGTKAAEGGLIDDLEDGNALAAPFDGRNGSWFVGKAEHATIEIPNGAAKPSAGGAPGSKHGMHFAGKTDTSDPWGAAVGVNLLANGGFYDASKYAGIAFKIKSAKPGLDVRLKLLDANTHPDGGQCSKECFNAFGRELILGTEWQDVSLMWSELTQQSDWGNPRPPMIAANKLKDVEWQIWPGNDFDIWIDDVHFIACE
jgi:hypothetical protein